MHNTDIRLFLKILRNNSCGFNFISIKDDKIFKIFFILNLCYCAVHRIKKSPQVNEITKFIAITRMIIVVIFLALFCMTKQKLHSIVIMFYNFIY